MDSAGSIAAKRADRFAFFTRMGLLLTGFLALASSDFLSLPALGLTAVLVAGLAAGAEILRRRFGWLAWVVTGAAFAELLLAAMVSASLSFLAFLGAFLVLLGATLAADEIRRAASSPVLVAKEGLAGFSWRLGQFVVGLTAGVLLLTAGFFLVLPRTAQAAFHRLLRDRPVFAGLGTEVRLGQIGRLLPKGRPAMYVRIVDAVQPPRLKWRGAVLEHFDGKTWRSVSEGAQRVTLKDGRAILASDDQRRLSGRRITYEVQVERGLGGVLFFVGRPEVVWIETSALLRTPGDSYRLEQAQAGRFRYGAISYLDPLLPEAPPGLECRRLPELDPRIAALAREVTSGLDSDEARAEALERYLRSNYKYTLELPPSEPQDALAEFLFVRRQGHCEYFASALAVMLRTVGIPSRLVTGFEGGSPNPVSGWYVVKASDAHSWVEAYLPDRGWITLDPTPAEPRRPPASRFAGLYAYLDAADLFWQNWVVNYDLSRQVTLAAKMQDSGRLIGERWWDRLRRAISNGWGTAIAAGRRYGGPLAGALLLVASLWVAVPKCRHWFHTRNRLRHLKRGEALRSDASLLYERMLRQLRQNGYSKPAWYTPDEFVRTLADPQLREGAARFTEIYQAVRFGGRVAEATSLPALLEELEKRS